MPDSTPSLYFFDMDHTLIDNDCDVSWKEFLIAKGLASPSARSRAAYFFEQYKDGNLQIAEFMAFQLAEFRGRTPEQMARLSREHFETFVRPTIYADAREKVQQVLNADVPAALLTATNEVVARPAAEEFGLHDILATRLEIRDGVYTGRTEGTYCGGPGKIEAADHYCKEKGCTLASAAYYGDSIADIPVLSAVGFPRPTNPSPGLASHAREQGWPIWTFS
ncbi:MAG: HAD family phosphatase [Candidatus Pacebacteria bacterium]|nr:HAD family phosphatase [Candidatus Paceibacterota bacterium]